MAGVINATAVYIGNDNGSDIPIYIIILCAALSTCEKLRHNSVSSEGGRTLRVVVVVILLQYIIQSHIPRRVRCGHLSRPPGTLYYHYHHHYIRRTRLFYLLYRLILCWIYYIIIYIYDFAAATAAAIFSRDNNLKGIFNKDSQLRATVCCCFKLQLHPSFVYIYS